MVSLTWLTLRLAAEPPECFDSPEPFFTDWLSSHLFAYDEQNRIRWAVSEKYFLDLWLSEKQLFIFAGEAFKSPLITLFLEASLTPKDANVWADCWT